jgi:hypothetical protein
MNTLQECPVMKIIVLLLTLTTFSISLPVSATGGSTEAKVLGEAFLNAMGGREPWKQARWVHNWAVNHHPQARTAYTQEAWVSLDEPRHYIKLRNFDMDRDRALDGNKAWRLTEGKFSSQTEEEVKQWRNNLQKSIYWKLSMLAHRDEALELVIGEAGRLEFRKDGMFLGWLILNDDGSPRVHGGDETTEVSTNFTELVSFGPINWVRSGAETTGWNFEILSTKLGDGPFPVSTAAPLPDQADD